MSNIANIVGGVIALAAINRLLDTKPTVVTPTPAPAPVIPTIGPAGPSVEDYKLIRESFGPGLNQGSGLTFSPITIKTLETFDPTKKVTVEPSGTMKQALIQVDAIKQGNIKKFGSGLYFGI